MVNILIYKNLIFNKSSGGIGAEFNTPIPIIQHGIDGIGHQLLGLFSLLLLHGVKNYYFDPYEFMKKTFNFEHLNEEDQIQSKNYMIEIVNQFNKEHNLKPQVYSEIIKKNGILNIPKPTDGNILYCLDNAYSKDIGFTNIENQKRLFNICKIKKYFINSFLPNIFTSEKNICIHIRCGDAMSRYKNKTEYDLCIIKIINKLKLLYPLYKIHIHSDGINPQIDNTIFYSKNTPILNVLSNFIYSNIIVVASSSLSMVSSFMGNKELVIVPDNILKYLLPQDGIIFSKFLDI